VSSSALPLLPLAAVSLAFGLGGLLVYARRVRAAGPGVFAAVCFVVAWYDIGCLGLYSSTDVAEAIRWQRQQFAAIAVLTPLLAWFVTDFVGRPSPRSLRVLWVAAVGFAGVALFSPDHPLVLDPSNVAEQGYALGAWTVSFPEAPPGILLEVQMVGSLLTFLVCLSLLVRFQLRARRDAGPMLVAFSFFFVACVNDALVAATPHRGPYLLEYGFAGVLFAVSWVAVSRHLALQARLEENNARLEERVRERTEALVEANRQLADAASHDFLTGLFNHRAFQDHLHELAGQARRYGTPFCLMLLDIDHFKEVNDTYGHPAGDAVLKAIAAALEESLRDVDIVCRHGGEEFAVLLPHTRRAGGTRVGLRLLDAVRTTDVEWNGITLRVTMSCGVSGWSASTPLEASALVLAADAALYEAKESGRDQLVVAPDSASRSA